MARTVLENGDIAIATLRKPSALNHLREKYPPNRLHILKLDVIDQDDIVAAFKYAKEKLGRIDIVFNNAGHGVIAEIEGTPEDAARKVFDVNFWGAMSVSREAIRFFRETNMPRGGRLWNISSIAGMFPFASLGYYSASKHGNLLWGIRRERLMTDILYISSGRCDRGACLRARPKVEHRGWWIIRMSSETVSSPQRLPFYNLAVSKPDLCSPNPHLSSRCTQPTWIPR